MTVWRPPAQIRVKALGLNWRHGRLLAAEVYDDSGRIKGVRPLGGGVEFGEPARVAVVREFHEELGVAVTIRGEPFFLENIFVHEGAPGHELSIIFNVDFPAGAFAGQAHIPFAEDNGATSIARWFDLDQLDQAGGPALYPDGLKARLQKS